MGGEIPKSSRETGGVEPRGELLEGTEENVVPPDPNCRGGIEDGRPKPSDVGVVEAEAEAWACGELEDAGSGFGGVATLAGEPGGVVVAALGGASLA